MLSLALELSQAPPKSEHSFPTASLNCSKDNPVISFNYWLKPNNIKKYEIRIYNAPQNANANSGQRSLKKGYTSTKYIYLDNPSNVFSHMYFKIATKNATKLQKSLSVATYFIIATVHKLNLCD